MRILRKLGSSARQVADEVSGLSLCAGKRETAVRLTQSSRKLSRWSGSRRPRAGTDSDCGRRSEVRVSCYFCPISHAARVPTTATAEASAEMAATDHRSE